MHYDEIESIWIEGIKHNINVETSTTCIVHCAMCPRAAIHLPLDNPIRIQFMKELEATQPLSINDFCKLSDFFKSLSLCGVFSDPIYWKEFPKALEIISEKYLDVDYRVSTAAHGPSLDWYESMFKKCSKNVHWIMGVDGVNGDTSRLYREKQNSELMIEAFSLASKKYKLQVTWQFIIFEHNVDELNQAKQLALDSDMAFLEVISDRLDLDVINRLNVKLGRENNTKDKIRVYTMPENSEIWKGKNYK